jgi:glutathione peroxidase-family protein
VLSQADTNEKIAENIAKFGAEFTILEPGDINGDKTNALHKFLKVCSIFFVVPATK